MKKIVKHMLTLVFVLGLIVVNTSAAHAANITTLNANVSGSQISVSGSCGAGVLACAIMVYDSNGTTLVDMETCAASGGSYTYTLTKTFDEGTYVVKVADYNGGDYVTAKVTVGTSSTSNTTTTSNTSSTSNTTTKKSPQTGERYPYNILLTIGLVAVALSVYSVKHYYRSYK